MAESLPALSYEDFVRERKLYWMRESRKLGAQVQIPVFEQVPLNKDDSNFIVDAPAPGAFFGLLEDDGSVGWFYLFHSDEHRIMKCTHVYNRSNMSVDASDVDVVWSSDYKVCGVAVWAEMRAFLGIAGEIEMRRPILSRDTPGFHVRDWPNGFRHLLVNPAEL